MDTFFISHGGPNLTLDESIPARAFMKSWRTNVLTAVPKAILIISGHWDTTVPMVNVINGTNPTIYDFGGLPREYYQIKYPAPGAPNLARRVKELLEKAGMGPVKEDKKRGLDHGAWVPLFLMYPEADIPVCQLSIQSHRDATYHYNLGKALAPLRDEGILIIGSGVPVHNMRAIHLEGGPVLKWALDFDTWLRESLLNGRYDDVNHYEEKAPSAKMAHPWPDHFYPLHVALGAAGEKAEAESIYQGWSYRSLSWASYRFSTSS